MKLDPSVTLIGDVVASRTAGDREVLHRSLSRSLEEMNAGVVPVEPLRLTVGDEFQGAFATLGDALLAAIRIRMSVRRDVGHELRCGLGWGRRTVYDPVTRTQDGPGWWAARAAIEEAKLSEGRGATVLRRLVYRPGEGAPVPGEAVNAALVCLDQILGRLDDRSVRILLGLLDGRDQSELARAEGISPSAVSQRVSRQGLNAVFAATGLLRSLP